jgi:hypothetical protein
MMYGIISASRSIIAPEIFRSGWPRLRTMAEHTRTNAAEAALVATLASANRGGKWPKPNVSVWGTRLTFRYCTRSGSTAITTTAMIKSTSVLLCWPNLVIAGPELLAGAARCLRDAVRRSVEADICVDAIPCLRMLHRGCVTRTERRRVASVSRRVPRLMFAGWLPQDGLFSGSGSQVSGRDGARMRARHPGEEVSLLTGALSYSHVVESTR